MAPVVSYGKEKKIVTEASFFSVGPELRAMQQRKWKFMASYILA